VMDWEIFLSNTKITGHMRKTHAFSLFRKTTPPNL